MTWKPVTFHLIQKYQRLKAANRNNERNQNQDRFSNKQNIEKYRKQNNIRGGYIWYSRVHKINVTVDHHNANIAVKWNKLPRIIL